MDKVVGRLNFNLSPGSLSGESLYINTIFYGNGDSNHGSIEGVYINQEIILHSYENSTVLKLYGSVLNSKILRELADSLDKELERIRNEKPTNS